MNQTVKTRYNQTIETTRPKKNMQLNCNHDSELQTIEHANRKAEKIDDARERRRAQRVCRTLARRWRRRLAAADADVAAPRLGRHR